MKNKNCDARIIYINIIYKLFFEELYFPCGSQTTKRNGKRYQKLCAHSHDMRNYLNKEIYM